MKDLRSYLAELERTLPQELQRISDEVDLEYELNAVTFEYLKKKNVCLFFERIKDYSLPLITNVFGTKERIALALGVPVDAIGDGLAGKITRKISPTLVDGGPVKEVKVGGSEVDLERLLPLPRYFEQDAGRYVTAGLVVAKNLEKTVTNLSFARMQLKGKNRLGVSFHSRGNQFLNLQRAKEVGKPLDVAVVIGGHPALHLAASGRIVDEYSVAGSFMQEPMELTRCETLDLEVPAGAEIVLEGQVSPTLEEDEGPFSEYTGYLSRRSTRNVIQINAATHRRKPLFLSIMPKNAPEHILLGGFMKQARVLRLIKDFLPVARIKGTNWPVAGVNFVSFLSLEKPIPGIAKQVALLSMGADPYLKLVVITDGSVDVTDIEEVLGAIARNVDHNKRNDLEIIDRVFCNVLDPSSREGMQSKVMIDATSICDTRSRKVIPDKKAILSKLQTYQLEDVHFPMKCEGLVAYLKVAGGDASELGEPFLAAAPECRLAIVTDPDINIYDNDEVLWSLATRVVPREDLLFLSGEGGEPKIIIDSRRAAGFVGIRPTLPSAIEERAKAFVARCVR